MDKKAESFMDFAVAMGCPSDCLPPLEYLQNLLYTRSGVLFETIQKRILTKDKVKEIRINLLIHSIEQSEEFLNHAVSFTDHKRYLRMKQLEKKINTIQMQCNQLRTQYDIAEKAVAQRNKSKMQVLAQSKRLCLMNKLLNTKLDALLEKKNSEEKYKALLIDFLPSKLDDEEPDKDIAIAIANSVKQLTSHYNSFLSNGLCNSAFMAREVHQSILKEMKLFSSSSIAQYFTYKQQEQYESLITTIQKLNSLSNNLSLQKSEKSLTSIDLMILKKYADILATTNEIKLIREKEEKLTAIYLELNSQYDSYVHTGMLSRRYNDADNLTEEITEYLKEFTFCSFDQFEKEFREKEIEKIGNLIVKETNKLSDFESVKTALHKTYQGIEDAVNCIQNDVKSLLIVCHKLRDLIGYCHKQIRVTAPNLNSTTLMKPSFQMPYNDSISFSDEVFSSTKMELENSIRQDVVTQRNEIIQPAHVDEIQQLYHIDKNILVHLSTPEPIKFHFTEESMDASKLKLLKRRSIETTSIILNEYEEMNRVVARSSAANFVNFEYTPNFDDDEETIKDKITVQSNKCKDIIRLIQSRDQKTAEWDQQFKRLYTFANTNPLREYIPLNKLFNGRSYKDYEDEFEYHYKKLKHD